MVISYDWLTRYLPVDNEEVKKRVTPEKLSQILTSIGLEVESLEKKENIRGGLEGLVVGEVLTCGKHPDADKLKLTSVSIGTDYPLQIVCGAPNVATGQKVIVAPVGTTVYPVTGDSFTIKKAKIRGVESEGMICAEDEIGLGTDHNGIKVLSTSLPAGTLLTAVYPVKTDYIFEIGLTPNRTDAMSHFGVARDVCAYLSYHLNKDIKPRSPLHHPVNTNDNGKPISIHIRYPEGCSRFCGMLIEHIEVKESPSWLKDRITSIGLNSINNIVDITNFILHETGQPLHVYDADKVAGRELIARSARADEPFIALDGKERKLNEGDVVIADSEKPLCIAGVYGGLNSGVTSQTKNILLESAWFDPAHVRRTSLKHNLRTDAASRFEKGVDIGNCDLVLEHAAQLILETCPEGIPGKHIDVYPNPVTLRSVELSFEYLQKLIGKKYSPEAVKSILSKLDFIVKDFNEKKIVVDVPTSKTDIFLPADLVEEILRIDGLDAVVIPKGIFITPSIDQSYTANATKEKVANLLTGMGFHETFTNSISSTSFYNKETLDHSIKMINSLSAELDVMRPALIPSVLQVVAHNQNRKIFNLRCFEFGKIYSQSENNFNETPKLCLYITGNLTDKGWRSKPIVSDFFHLKTVVENLFTALGLNTASFIAGESDQFIHYSEIRLKKQAIGFMGEIHPEIRKSFDVKQEVYYAEIDWNPVLIHIAKQHVTFSEIPKYPAVTRDLSLVIDRNTHYGEIRDTVKQLNIPVLKSVRLFDLFESEKLGENKKAMAVSFTIQDETKTLTDGETDAIMKKIIDAVEKQNGAIIRK